MQKQNLLAIELETGKVDVVLIPGNPVEVGKSLLALGTNSEEIKAEWGKLASGWTDSDGKVWMDGAHQMTWTAHIQNLYALENLTDVFSAIRDEFSGVTFLYHEAEEQWDFSNKGTFYTKGWIPLRFLLDYPIGSPIQIDMNGLVFCTGHIVGYSVQEDTAVVECTTDTNISGHFSVNVDELYQKEDYYA